jgi:NAD(P)-dependent dehydrogenase (short-subunit alcohol dehydrogenase family)
MPRIVGRWQPRIEPGVVQALVAQGAQVTVLARDVGHLTEVAATLPVATLQGDMVDSQVVDHALASVQPEVLILNGGATPHMAPLREKTCETFSRNWDVDVKATCLWIQAVLAGRMSPVGRVLLSSSGAALNGSTLSGSHAGAKRMVWLLCEYADGFAAAKGVDLAFQAVVPLQIVGDTHLGRASAEAYARRRGIRVDAFLAGFGPPLLPADYGRYLVAMLTDPALRRVPVLSVKGGVGVAGIAEVADARDPA